MLINRWLSLILLFVICGCGSWKQKYENLLTVHEETQQKLSVERTAHRETQQKLSVERTAHRETQQKLSVERTAHGKTQQKLSVERTAHGKTQQKLSVERTAHGKTQQKLSVERTAHGKTQQKLDIKESSLKTVRDTLDQIKKENSNLAKRYRDLIEIKEPLIRDYFELGRVSLEFGITKEDAGKIKEGVSLFSQARNALKEAIKGNETSEAHYYLARAYYRLAKRRSADFKDACAHAKKAIALAPRRKHEGAEALKKKIANCK